MQKRAGAIVKCRRRCGTDVMLCLHSETLRTRCNVSAPADMEEAGRLHAERTSVEMLTADAMENAPLRVMLFALTT